MQLQAIGEETPLGTEAILLSKDLEAADDVIPQDKQFKVNKRVKEYQAQRLSTDDFNRVGRVPLEGSKAV